MSRTAHFATGPITALMVSYGNFRLSTADESGAVGASTITASIEYPAGTFTQLKFGGNVQGNISAAGYIISDMSANVFIPEGAIFWIRFYITSAAGIFLNNWRNTGYGEAIMSGVSGIVDMTMGGTVSSSFNQSVPPLGIYAYTDKKSVCFVGDSKTWGQNDTAESATASTAGIRGEIGRSFASVEQTLAFANFASPGLQAYDFVNNPSYVASRKALLGYHSHFVVNIGRNDFWQRHRTTAQVQGDVQSIIAAILAANPAAKITLCTQTHASNSTDNWATTVNQTVASATDNSRRNAYNDLVRLGTAQTGINNGYFEISDLVETSRGSSIWPADGTTPFLNTADGVHESALMYAVIAASGNVDLTRFS